MGPAFKFQNRRDMGGHGYRFSKTCRICLLVSVALVLGGRSVSSAGGDETRASSAHAPQLEPLTTAQWDFGIRVTGASDTAGITATFPIPDQWPEQTVRVVKQKTSPQVGRVDIRSVADNVQQVVFRVPQLAAGQTAEVIITVEIEKKSFQAPQDTSTWRFADPVPGDIRRYLAPSPYIESNHRRIVQLAQGLPIDAELPAWDQVELIYNWVRDNIRYVFDEQIRTCLEALDAGQGDCEEMSSLFIALCRARGIPARAVWIPGHTYPEFYLQDERGNGQWFPCQVAGDYAFGNMVETRPILQKGDRFRVTGQRQMQRYIQPTLIARDAPIDPTVQWIIQPTGTD